MIEGLSNGDLVYYLVLSVASASLVAFLFLSSTTAKKAQAHVPFKSLKKLGVKEELLLKMLCTEQGKGNGVCFVITDFEQPDNPIVYASPAFCSFTQYRKEEIEGRNCRFLQGDKTDKKHVAQIRKAVEAEMECSLELVNHKKDGTTFLNQFFLCPLYGPSDNGKKTTRPNKLQYFLGVQCEIGQSKEEVGYSQEGENAAFRLFTWLT
jgi:PAS domain S-box-containing protein